MAVKTTDKSKMIDRSQPPRNSSLPALALLCLALLLLLASCRGGQPAPPVDTPIPVAPTEALSPMPTTAVNPSPTLAPTPGMAPPPAATEPAAQASNAEGDRDDRTKIAVQQLFETWNRAIRDDDAALFHSLLTRELAESCGLDQLQLWLDQEEEFLAEAVVTAVFLDVADFTRAYAEIAVEQGGGRPHEPGAYPWPVALEDGKWRAGFPLGLTANRCPYVADSPSSGPEGRESEFPQIPGLDLERREDILAAVPGTRVLRGSSRTRNSGSSFNSAGSMLPYDNQVSIYAEVETESVAAELVRLYRDELNHPSWEIVDESSSGDFGWFSWTVRDTDGRLWQGMLVVAPLHEGWKEVRLSLFSNDADDSQ